MSELNRKKELGVYSFVLGCQGGKVKTRFFLQKMGIVERANILSKKMNFNEQANLYLRLKRLLDKKFMGDLFKVIFAYKFNRNDFPGFN